MKRLALVVVLALGLFVVWRIWRGRRDESPAPPPAPAASTVDVVLARERAAAHFEHGELENARADLAPLVSVPEPALEDLERAAVVEYMDRVAGGEPETWLERLRARDPANATLHYMEARLALERGEFEAAREHFRAALKQRPDDLAARVGLAGTLADLGDASEARKLLDEIVAEGVERAGHWYVQAVYRLGELAKRTGPPEEAQQLGALFEQLRELGYRSATPDELDRGTLAFVRPPRESVAGASPGRMPAFVAEPAVVPELAGARELFALDLDADGDTDLLAAGPQGVVCALQGTSGYQVETVLEGPAEHVRAFDLGNDDDIDLLVCRGTELVLLEPASGEELLLGGGGASRWTRSPLALPNLPAPPADLLLVDFDHEGDLDLLLVGPFGARLLRDDGAAGRKDAQGVTTRGAFTDVSAEASLPDGIALTWCAVEDFDEDQDVDLLLGGPRALVLMDSLRAGKFVDCAARAFGAGRVLAREPLIADLDGDARPDLLEPGLPSTLWRRRADGTFAPEPTSWRIDAASTPIATDIDLDGTTDVLWASATAAAEGVLGFGIDVAQPATIAGRGEPSEPLALVDLDRDLDLDLVRAGERGLEVFRCTGPVGNAARIELVGLKDNRRALGAIVELRTRGLYRRVYYRGEPVLAASGRYPSIDVVRTTWPNGAVLTRLDVPPGDHPFLDTEGGRLEQSDSLIGSCPFLYTWNGSTFEFVSDVLGGTPLGLPIRPGLLVPPDHDEYVLVRGTELAPRDGVLELQLTEELREVTYLDRVRLEVVDHPQGSEVYPNERFTFPPFPEPHLHTVREPLAPTRAIGSDGADWTAALAAIDDVHAQPFAPLEPQFLGLATPHWLELEFDPARVRSAKHLRLVCTGWFFWTDASVNVASARVPGVSFVPPTIEVPGPPGDDGEWRAIGPPVGFPAGKSKTMVIELGDVLDRERPRLRISSTLRLYWDSIRLAVDDDDEARTVTALEPIGATLWPRGFSQPVASTRDDLPERFVWDALAELPRWNQHPGRYTRYGETLPLVQAVDDRFVILGSGDALAIRFDARACPPLAPGWTRDYLVFLDGWAKDRDPNTLEALAVEPLPFHGMSGYPYGPGEAFPSDAEHEAWRAEWNTRDARRWIVPLAPTREAEWAAELGAGQ